MQTIETIKAHRTMQEVLADSFGGVMYNVANRDKYDVRELLEAWEALPAAEKEAADGIVRGAINFLQGK